jgi:O-antigen ligase
MLRDNRTTTPVASILTTASAPPKKIVYVRQVSNTVPIILRFSFLLFVFTLPFENVDLSGIRGASSLARMSGLFFFACAVLYPKICFRRPPRMLWWFTGYVAVFILFGLFIPHEFSTQFSTRLNTLIQLLVLFWFASNLLREEKQVREALIVFSLATVCAAMALLLRLPGFTEATEVYGGGVRSSLSGFNPNDFSIILALGCVALIGLGVSKSALGLWSKIVPLVLSLPLLAAMVSTSSRGGVLAFLLGVALYPLPYRKARRKMTAVVWAVLGIVGIVYLIASDPTSVTRWTRTYNKGDTAGRDKIFTASMDMIAESPIAGWNPIVFWYELGPRVGWKKRDAHNLVLHLFLEVGTIGALPFLIGLWLCAKAAWKARIGNLGLLPLALLVSMLVGNMANTWLTRKPLWVVLAIAASSAYIVVREQGVRIVAVSANASQQSP